MKICPRCQRTYTDDNLNFCLDDGVVLQQTAAEPPATVFMNQPQPTDPRPVAPSQPGFQPAWNTAPQPYAMQPKKSSKTWIWVLLVLGLVVVLCGGGLIGVILVASRMGNDVVANGTNSSNGTNTRIIATNKSTPS